MSEGLATAFERDFAGTSPPWGSYGADASSWVEELLTLPLDPDTSAWMVRHPDGRRWIGYKAGTFLADRATEASGRSSADLVGIPTAELIALAGVR